MSEQFCKKLQNAVKEEDMAVGEYEALALDALKLSGEPQKEAVSILLEKIRDDEGSHRDALKKIVFSVCPI